MSSLTDLTVEECTVLLALLKTEAARRELAASSGGAGNACAGADEQQEILENLLWRLQIVCSSRAQSDEALRQFAVDTEGVYC